MAAAHLDSSSHHSAGLTSSLDGELFGEIDDFQAAVVPNSAERASQITFDLAGRYVDICGSQCEVFICICIHLHSASLRQSQVLVFFVYRVRFFAGDRDWIPSRNLRGKGCWTQHNTTSRCIKSLHFDSVSESAFLFQRQWSLSTFSTWQSWSSAKWCQVATELGCSKWIVPLSLASDILHFLFAFSTSRRAAKLIGDMPEEFRLFIFFQSFLRCFPMFYSVFLFVCLLTIVYLWLHLSEKLRKPAWSAPCSELTKLTHIQPISQSAPQTHTHTHQLCPITCIMSPSDMLPLQMSPVLPFWSDSMQSTESGEDGSHKTCHVRHNLHNVRFLSLEVLNLIKQ